jgi:hypothetical protein
MLAVMHTICFRNKLGYSAQVLVACSNLEFNLNIDNSESPKRFELVFNTAFSRDASWHDRFGCIADQQTKQSNSSIEDLRGRVKMTIVGQSLSTCRSQKSGPRLPVLVIHGEPILLHDDFDVFNDCFKESIGNASAMDFERRSVPQM